MQVIGLSTFFVGFSTAWFSVYAYLILRQHRLTRIQRLLGYIFVVWAIFNLKDIVLSSPSLYTQRVLEDITVVDGWSAITYMVFTFELTMPGWTTVRRVLAALLPFAVFTVVWFATRNAYVLRAYYAFLVIFALAVLFIGIFKARQHIRYVRENYSNIDEIDISWVYYVFFFTVVSQLSWLFTSFAASPLVDAFYYLSCIVLWQMVLKKSYHLKPVVMEKSTVQPANRTYPFAGTMEQTVEHDALYLNKDLTLSELAAAVGTNRTYLSEYFSNVKHVTFYDYINQLRITKKSIPMMAEHPEYTLEHIAAESGFNSISTFRRAFYKLTGNSPSRYRSMGPNA